MKLLVNISRLLVGLLFIFSGLIKLNDPVGFSFKLEEYFSEGVLNLPFLMPLALAIAMVLVIFETVLGVMLLLGYKPKFTVWSLLLMIVFFTFLTFYSAYFNKVTDCGCFGDAIKLTPWQSFYKDVVLLVLILVLFFGWKHIKPLFTKKIVALGTLFSLVVCCILTYYVYNHLPVIDFRAYKVGTNILEGMSVPEGAPKAVYEYAWKFDVNGTEKIVVTNGDYPSVEGKFVGVETTQISKGYEPPIHDFSMEKDGEDLTETFMAEDKLIIITAYDFAKTSKNGLKKLKTAVQKARGQGYKVIGLSASSEEEIKPILKEAGLDVDFYFCDMTTVKTIERANPSLIVLKKGTIVQKLHYNDASELDF